MNLELPPFKHGEHNSVSVSTLDPDITPFKNTGTYSFGSKLQAMDRDVLYSTFKMALVIFGQKVHVATTNWLFL